MTDEEIREWIDCEKKAAVAKLKAEIVKYFGHELSEMTIELTGPDIRPDFTLERVKRLQRKLAKL